MGEGYLWNNAGFKYDTVYIKKVIYICEYLEGGLLNLAENYGYNVHMVVWQTAILFLDMA